MDVFFVTNRNPEPSNDAPRTFGPRFNECGHWYLPCGKAAFDLPAAAGHLNEPPRPDRLTVYKENVQEGRYGSRRLIAALTGLVLGEEPADLLVYIHGYNNSFTDALATCCQLTHNLDHARRLLLDQQPGFVTRPLVPLLVTWPSDGVFAMNLSYLGDRVDGRGSRQALARILLKLRDGLEDVHAAAVRAALPGPPPVCNVRIHLLAHSMGTFVLRHGLQEFLEDATIRGRPLPRIFDRIMLLASDEEDEALDREDMLRPLAQMANGLTVYHNPRDQVLMGSQNSKNFSRRLGQAGPDRDVDLNNVTCVDVSKVIDPPTNLAESHAYHRLNPAVLDDMMRELAGAASPNRRPLPGRRWELGLG